jgi:hypothetical protein
MEGLAISLKQVSKVKSCELYVINVFGPFERKTIHDVRKLNQNI